MRGAGPSAATTHLSARAGVDTLPRRRGRRAEVAWEAPFRGPKVVSSRIGRGRRLGLGVFLSYYSEAVGPPGGGAPSQTPVNTPWESVGVGWVESVEAAQFTGFCLKMERTGARVEKFLGVDRLGVCSFEDPATTSDPYES